MDIIGKGMKLERSEQWKFIEKSLLVTTYVLLLVIQCDCQTIPKETSHTESKTKGDLDRLDYKLDSNNCHNCHTSSRKINENVKDNDNYLSEKDESFIDKLATTVGVFTEKYLLINKTQEQLQKDVENLLDNALKRDRYEVFSGIEIKIDPESKVNKTNDENEEKEQQRALFSKYTYEYRLLQKIKNFINTHIISIDFPKVGSMDLRSFGLKKFLLPIIIGIQIFKGMLFAMFLPSILGSFGKILGKGISHISAASSQASYPPANNEEPAFTDNKEVGMMGYETDPTASFAYPQDGMYSADANDVNDMSTVDMSRFGMGGQKVSYLPTKNSYYKNQIASASNHYKIFQKIPASSMILSNYDPFYSPLLSRLDAIFARLGLLPSENTVDQNTQIGGQSLSDVKLEACREQLICQMYASPAKYAPYSNLVSAQLSRELNELRRPVSDNPEILRFFRYMRAARRGQEGTDCVRAHPACQAQTSPTHTMVAAYQDLNKLVTARRMSRS